MGKHGAACNINCCLIIIVLLPQATDHKTYLLHLCLQLYNFEIYLSHYFVLILSTGSGFSLPWQNLMVALLERLIMSYQWTIKVGLFTLFELLSSIRTHDYTDMRCMNWLPWLTTNVLSNHVLFKLIIFQLGMPWNHLWDLSIALQVLYCDPMIIV